MVKEPLSGLVDKASATETVDSGSIQGQVKLKLSNWYSQLLLDVGQLKLRSDLAGLYTKKITNLLFNFEKKVEMSTFLTVGEKKAKNIFFKAHFGNMPDLFALVAVKLF